MIHTIKPVLPGSSLLKRTIQAPHRVPGNPPKPATPGMVGLEIAECGGCLCNSTGGGLKQMKLPCLEGEGRGLGTTIIRIIKESCPENFLSNSPSFGDITIFKPNLKRVQATPATLGHGVATRILAPLKPLCTVQTLLMRVWSLFCGPGWPHMKQQ